MEPTRTGFYLGQSQDEDANDRVGEEVADEKGREQGDERPSPPSPVDQPSHQSDPLVDPIIAIFGDDRRIQLGGVRRQLGVLYEFPVAAQRLSWLGKRTRSVGSSLGTQSTA